jgi:hypothetical protein
LQSVLWEVERGEQEYRRIELSVEPKWAELSRTFSFKGSNWLAKLSAPVEYERKHCASKRLKVAQLEERCSSQFPRESKETNMRAAIITAAGKPPVYGEFNEPGVRQEMELTSVRSSALSQFTKSRSSGSHYNGRSTSCTPLGESL